MGTYIVRRLLMAVLILVLVTFIVFFAIRLLPGDPLLIFLGAQASSGQGITDEEIARLRHDFGLDEPLMVQYGNWIWGVLRGDLGESMTLHENVGSLMLDRLPVTLQLGLVAFIFSNILGIIFGVLAAIRRGTWIDTVVTTLANIGITIPVFWLGFIIIIIFGLNLGWLPRGGWVFIMDDFWGSIWYSIGPIICLSVTGLASTARIMRSSMLEVVRQDYIRTAWSKGLTERAIISKHALKNSLIPILTMAGIGLGIIMGGSVLIETVFGIPGMGRLLVTGMFGQDYIIVQSGVLVLAGIIILTNLAVDISYGWLDPRIRYG